jgi:hypothetical protein
VSEAPGIVLQHPQYADHREEHIERPFDKKQEEDLNYLLLRMENCRKNMADHFGAPEFGMHALESQIAELSYRLRWSEIRHERTRESYLAEMERSLELHQRMSNLEEDFRSKLSDTVTAAVAAQYKRDETYRLIAAYKNGLQRGESRAAGKKTTTVLKQPTKEK